MGRSSLLLALFICTAAVSQPSGDSLTVAITADRRSTEEWLRSSPTSYLATIDRVDFGDRTALTIGRSAECDVRIDDPSVSARHARVTVVQDSFLVEGLDAGAMFDVKGLRRRRVVGPSTIGIGRFLIRLSHQRFPAVIVFDPKSPRFAAYKGLKYFPIDLSLRYVLRLTPSPTQDTVIILSTRGNQRHALDLGWFDLTIGGKACRLSAHRLLEPGVGESSVSIFFRDGTSGKESYGMGRYVDAEPLGDGRYVLDFNKAYNPACAFSPHYNCPIPTTGNTLPVPVRAGEMDAHYVSHE